MLRFFEKILNSRNNEYERTRSQLQHKDILNLSEAILLLDTEPEILIEEIIRGHIPAGKIGGEWCFFKQDLLSHFQQYFFRVERSDLIPRPMDSDYYRLFESTSVCELLGKVNESLISEISLARSRGRTYFADLDLRGANLSAEPRWDGSDFSNCILVGANFENCDLSFANFSDSNCKDANFSGANLEYAYFENADLSHANFSNSALIFADLTGTNKFKLNLNNAEIFKTKF